MSFGWQQFPVGEYFHWKQHNLADIWREVKRLRFLLWMRLVWGFCFYVLILAACGMVGSLIHWMARKSRQPPHLAKKWHWYLRAIRHTMFLKWSYLGYISDHLACAYLCLRGWA